MDNNNAVKYKTLSLPVFGIFAAEYRIEAAKWVMILSFAYCEYFKI